MSLEATSNPFKAVPSESPLDMPRHHLYESSIPLRAKRGFTYIAKTLLARLFLLITTGLLANYGITEIYNVLKDNGITFLQWFFLVLFSVNFIWISYAFAQAFLGFIVSLLPKLLPLKETDPSFKTAILFPIYNEHPTHIRAAIEAMRDDLRQKSPNKYAFFILSDTNSPENWLAEELMLMPLIKESKNSSCPVFYRRRPQNTERKAGNIADWVTRWGGDYEAMIVLDADSLIGADSLISLSRRLAAAPKVGLIQTLPTIIRAKTLYSRLQQFANHCYGPIYANGLSAWHGMSSNFWGHNAIIRTKAFASASCLPILKGKAPFGGHILSHDFIEAALLRRAGWGVRFDTDITATYEEAPPSLTDVIIRDRRWCQGNLQHFPFMLAQGFPLPTRLHIFSGIMSYLSAVFWLMLIMVGLAIALQAMLVLPEYFTNPSLFPTWPVFDAQRALHLFYISMGLLLAPKIFGWFTVIINFNRWRAFGGPIILTLSVITELLLSALYAPILLVSQFGVVYSIFKGKDSGWMPQSRDDGALSWQAITRVHASHTAFGLLLTGIALYLNTELFFWLLPISAGLMLSIPLSWISGGQKRTRWLSTLGVLRAPEEQSPRHSIVESLEQHLALLPGIPETFILQQLVDNSFLYEWHMAQLDHNGNDDFHAPTVTAEWKINHTNNLSLLQSQLNSDELMAILSSPTCLTRLKQLFSGDNTVPMA